MLLDTGVELNRAAIADAKENAKMNGMEKTRFIAADATKYMMDAAARKESYDVVFLDPPRSGTTPEFISACEKLSPKRIVYVSCDPETLARDLKEFKKRGYDPQYAIPVDMFPFTSHVETVCLLSNRKPDARVKIDVDLEDYYRIKDEQKKNKASE